MPQTPFRHAHRAVCALLSGGVLDGLSDGELIERFLAGDRDVAECAFAALVARHGPMVRRVCRAVLNHAHDADDAFQATFLVAAQRAAAIRNRDSVGSWLYGVAYRTAMCAKVAASRRRKHEHRAAERAVPTTASGEPSDFLLAVNEEISRLPENYRAVFVVCVLEGLTQEQAAERLGWPIGTVRSRLARGRERLRARLARRNLAPEQGAWSPFWAPRTPATVPDALAQAVVQGATQFKVTGAVSAQFVSAAAIDLMKGASVTMLGTRLKMIAIGILAMGIALAGARILVGQERKDVSPPPANDQAADLGATAARVDVLERRIQGLERRLETLVEGQARGNLKVDARGAGSGDVAARLRKVRLRFPGLIQQVFIAPGQKVRVGEPLAELYSPDLIAAKNDLLIRQNQWERDQQLVQAREKLHAEGAVSTQALVDTRNNEHKSRFDQTLARDRLAVFGLTREQIDAVKNEEGEKKGHFTFRTPVSGIVVSVEAQPGDLLDALGVLLTLRADGQ